MKLYSLGISALLLALGSFAMAYPTLNAHTGLITLPNAYTADSGIYTVAADMMFAGEDTLKARVLYGLSERAEIGASFSTGVTEGVSISGKYQLTDPYSEFNLAGGGSVILADNSDTLLDLFLVASRSFAVGSESGKKLLGTFGVHFINFHDDNTLRPFIGAQYPLGENTEIAAEYQFSKGNIFASPLASVVLRHGITPSLTGQVGFSNASGYGSTNESRLFIGAAYTFNKAR